MPHQIRVLISRQGKVSDYFYHLHHRCLNASVVLDDVGGISTFLQFGISLVPRSDHLLKILLRTPFKPLCAHSWELFSDE